MRWIMISNAELVRSELNFRFEQVKNSISQVRATDINSKERDSRIADLNRKLAFYVYFIKSNLILRE